MMVESDSQNILRAMHGMRFLLEDMESLSET